MVSEKRKVSQNFGQISRVSLARFLRGSERLAVSNFLQSQCGVWLSRVSQSKELKKYRSRREKRWSRRLAKACIYHSLPLKITSTCLQVQNRFQCWNKCMSPLYCDTRFHCGSRVVLLYIRRRLNNRYILRLLNYSWFALGLGSSTNWLKVM